jgi:hypothetical protein
MRLLIVVLAAIAFVLPASAQYQNMTAEQCRRIADSQQRLTCLGQVRRPPGPSGASPFGPIQLLPQIQPVVQPPNPAPKAPDRSTTKNRPGKKSESRR